eukprot:6787626-Prymnesium_polylepis.1
MRLLHKEQQRRREEVHRLAVADPRVAMRVRVQQPAHRRLQPPRVPVAAERALGVRMDQPPHLGVRAAPTPFEE